MHIFDYKYVLLDFKDILKIKKKFRLKKLNILDFGCGIGFWEFEQIKIINNIILFDKNKKLIPYLKKKYSKNKNISINFNKKEVFKKNINIILISSVIQYMNNLELEELFSEISKRYNKKEIIVFINDHPVNFRIVEFFLLPFINIRKFFESLKLILRIKYLKTNYYKHDLKQKKFIKKRFNVTDFGYIEDMKFLRKKFILTLKNK
tara:strand:+ start:3081 stop:3698 length:618 start_codon:yes stop_codon:yes gene_type:complete